MSVLLPVLGAVVVVAVHLFAAWVARPTEGDDE